MYEVQQVKEGYVINVYDTNSGSKREIGYIKVDKVDILIEVLKAVRRINEEIKIDTDAPLRPAELGRLVNKLING